MANAPTRAQIEALAARLSPNVVSTDASDLVTYGRDWTKVHTPAPSAILLPRSTHEVAEIMRFCDIHELAVVPSGGRTGLAAGAVAAHGELVLSLERMHAMHEVDTLGQTVRVQAGAVTEAVHRHCEPHGLTWPVDFASKGSSQVGGNIATNAGGVKVIRYGLTRQWVLGLEVVLANGTVLSLNGALEKNNTGVDLRQLMIGSEGTLGIVTEATLKLARLPTRLDVMLFAVRDLDAVLSLFAAARTGPFALSAFEFFTDRCLARVQRHRTIRAPFADTSHSHYVLVETDSADPEALELWVASLFERELITDGTMAQNSSQARSLWELRESISESLSGTGLPHKNDIALPIAALREFCASLDALFARQYPEFEICLFGHIGDGNLHVNVMKPEAMSREEFFARTSEADHAMFSLVKSHGGSISAEHGVGLLKKPYLGYSRTPEELMALRAIKQALDPKRILNPGKIFDIPAK
ncbi:MAG: FAD-binding oxidoreductase [Deltaproteobacteria bacterium]|nr:FAD-binding oxidoreductase [Deltaproteobacteria bacterium]